MQKYSRFRLPLLRAVWGPLAILSLSGLNITCTPGPSFYFAEQELVPELTGMVGGEGNFLNADDGTLAQYGLAGGATVVLSGSRLQDPSLSVRFGAQAAQILERTTVDGTDKLTVQIPAGPRAGGQVPVQVVSPHGVSATLVFEYRLPDPTLFADEVGSLVLVGQQDGAVVGALRFWPEREPRGGSGLIEQGSLYYHPGNRSSIESAGEGVEWPTAALFTAVPGRQSLESVERVQLAPVSDSAALPFSFAFDSLQRQFDFCVPTGTEASLWNAGTDYDLELSGGALPTPLRTTLRTPSGFLQPGQHFQTLPPDAQGVATVNMNLDLRLDLEPPQPLASAATYLLAEVVVHVPSLSLSEQPYVVQRLSFDVDPDTEQLILPSDLLQHITPVNTTCARLGQQLERARLLESADVSDYEEAYLEAGCENVDAPLSMYKVEAELRLSRHAVYPVALTGGIAGCASPGSCGDDGQLVVDLVTQLRVPVNISDLPVSDCVDFEDNDRDGLVDELDPGCTDPSDLSEQDPLLVCDDGRDNDGDGRYDQRIDGTGDPGCDSPTDDSERGVGVCDDAKDNDGDGTLDFVLAEGVGDPGCSGVNDISENEASLTCDDGKDNDGDNRTDFQVIPQLGDPGCSSPTDPNDYDETGTWPCDDRIDNDGDGTVDTEDPGCRPGGTAQHSPYETNELNPIVECDDGVDNDADDTIDFRVDPNAFGDVRCVSVNDTSERL